MNMCTSCINNDRVTDRTKSTININPIQQPPYNKGFKLGANNGIQQK